MKIGVFGGTFNPVHLGHTHLAQSVFESLKLDSMLIIPDKIPPHKQAVLVDENHRLEMLKLAFEKYSWSQISDIEFKREGKSYSVLTLRELKNIYPNDQFYFVMGSDMLLSFKQWFCYEEILSLCSLAVVARNKQDIEKISEYANELDGNINIVSVKPLEISSTQVRNAIKQGSGFEQILDKRVTNYILKNKLYL